MGILEAIQQGMDLLPRESLLKGEQQEIKINLISALEIFDDDLIGDSMVIEVYGKNNLQYFTFYYDGHFIGQVLYKQENDVVVIKYISSINMLNRSYKVDTYYEYTKCKYIKSKDEMLGDTDLPKDKISLNIRGIGTYMLLYVLQHLKKVGNKRVLISTGEMDVRRFFDTTLSWCKELGIIKSHCIQIRNSQEIPMTEGYLVDL